MFGACGIGCDVGQVHFRLLAGRQLDLGFLRRFLQALQRQRVVVQVDAAFLLELRREVFNQAQVEVLTAEEGVTVGRQHFELVLAIDFGNLDDGDVEGTATEVVHSNRAIALGLVHAVGERRCGRLVDDALHFQAGNTAGVLGCLALGIVEVRRHRDHRLGDGFTQVLLGSALHFAQHLGGDLRRRHFLVLGLYPGIAVIGFNDLVRHHFDIFLYHVVLELASNQALHGVQRVVGVGDGLALGALPDQNFAILGVGHNRRRGAIAFGILDHARFAPFEHRDAGVGGTQVDTDYLAHVFISSFAPARPAAVFTCCLYWR